MTPQERKVMELALDALQDYVDEYGPWSDDSGPQYVLRVGKEALAQQAAVEHDLAVAYRTELDKLSQRNYELRMENAQLKAQPKEPEQEPVVWRNAAIRVGEDLCSVAPFGYYDMTAQQWLDWALSVVTVHTPPPPKRKPLTDEQLDKAGMKLAECMYYPWEHMPEEGKRNMRDLAKAIIEAAHGIKGY